MLGKDMSLAVPGLTRREAKQSLGRCGSRYHRFRNWPIERAELSKKPHIGYFIGLYSAIQN
jgi:hypothetical protein